MTPDNACVQADVKIQFSYSGGKQAGLPQVGDFLLEFLHAAQLLSELCIGNLKLYNPTLLLCQALLCFPGPLHDRSGMVSMRRRGEHVLILSARTWARTMHMSVLQCDHLWQPLWCD